MSNLLSFSVENNIKLIVSLLAFIFLAVFIAQPASANPEGVFYTDRAELLGMSCDGCNEFPLPTDNILTTATSTGDFDDDDVNDIAFLTDNDAIKVFDANDQEPRIIQLGAPTFDQEHNGPKPYPKGHFSKGGEMDQPVNAAAMITDPSDDAQPGNHGPCNKGNGKGKGKKGKKKKKNKKTNSNGDCDSSDETFGEWPVTTFAIGAWNNFDEAIYFTNQEHDKIYRVRPGESVTVLAKPHSGVNAVLGFGDVDADGQKELTFLDAGQQPRYMEERDIGFHKSFPKLNTGNAAVPGSGEGIGVGAPADFTGDGVAGLPVVTEDNDIALLYKNKSPNYLGQNPSSGCDCAAKAPVSITDVDNDGLLEVAAVIQGDQFIGYFDDDGVTGRPLKTSNGEFVKADVQRGVGSSFAAEFLIDRDESPLEQTDFARVGLQFTQSSSIKKLSKNNGSIKNLPPNNVEVLATNTIIRKDLLHILFLNNSTEFGFYQPETGKLQTNTLQNPADVDNTLFGVGRWDGSLTLVYPGQSNDKMYSFRGVVANPVNGVTAVSGLADVTGGSQKELVFVDATSERNLRYVPLSDRGNTNQKTYPKLQTSGVTPGEPDAIGDPGDFDGDGKASVPIVDENNGVALVADGESPQYLGLNQAAGCDCAEKSSVAPIDIDSDGKNEFLFIDKTEHTIKYFDNLGASPQPVLDQNGNPIETDTSTIGPISRIGVSDTPDEARSDTVIKAARDARFVLRSGGFTFTDSKQVFQMGAEQLLLPTFGEAFTTKQKGLYTKNNNAEVLGEGEADFDGDTYADIPYLSDSATIRLTDRNDTRVRIDANAIHLPAGKEARTDSSALAVGTFNRVRQDVTWSEVKSDTLNSGFTSLVLGQNNSIFYASYNGDTIYGVGNAADTENFNDTPPVTVGVPANGVSAISGFGDVDYDSELELVFVDGGMKLRYMEESDSGPTEKTFPKMDHGSTSGPAINKGIGVGSPIQFPSQTDEFGLTILDGTDTPVVMTKRAAGVPVVTADNDLAMMYANDTPVYLASKGSTVPCDCAAISPIATMSSGLVFFEKGTNKFSSVTWDSKPQAVKNASGNRVTGDLERGAFFLYAAAGDPDKNELPCLIENLVPAQSVLDHLRAARDIALDTELGRYLTGLYYEWFGSVGF